MLFIIRIFLTKFAALNVIVIVLATWQVVPTLASTDEDITIVPVLSLLLSDPFSVTGGTVIEGDDGYINPKTLNFTFKLDTYIENASINYETKDGTATTAGDDYIYKEGKVTFSPGSLSQIVRITINGDTDPEKHETFSLILSNPVNLKLSGSSVIGTIIDDDGPLNDTGIITCTGEVNSAQDCSHGRDVTHNDDSDGHAGFSYTKISSTGQELSASDSPWSCVKDNVTGLTWEKKTDDGGLHDKDNLYTWYNTNPATNGGMLGSPGLNNNNTQAYVERVNSDSLCGKSDWRMPTHKELHGIVSYDRSGPAIDTGYFPHTTKGRFWSGVPTDNSFDTSNSAWTVSFVNGHSLYKLPTGNFSVRLVRAGQ